MTNKIMDNLLFVDLKVLCFKHQLQGGEHIIFALNAYKIREVVTCPPLSPLSSDYLPYVSIFDYRGIPVPVINLNHVVPDSLPSQEFTRIAIVESLGRLTGVLVESHLRIQEFSNEDLKNQNFIGTNNHANYVSGLLRDKNNERYIHLLNLEAIILPHLDEAIPKTHRVNAKNKKVLIVEDSVLFQRKVEGLLKNMGFSIVIANDGAAGLEKLTSEHFDLIFTDIEMPRMNGIEMIRKFKANPLSASTVVIFHSSLSTPSLIDLIEEEQLGSYATKFDDRKIIELLEKNFPIK